MIDKKQMLYGALLGAVVPPIAFVLWVLLFTDYSIERALDLVVKGSLYSEVLSLSAIANMIIFYIFLNKNKIFIARGILLITIFLAFVVLATKLI
jgi:hypothetical protein